MVKKSSIVNTSFVSVGGSQGKKKYRVLKKDYEKTLVDARKYLKDNKITSVVIDDGCSYPWFRKGTMIAIVRMATLYKSFVNKNLIINSGYRPGDLNWHGTGWAVDFHITPTTPKDSSRKPSEYEYLPSQEQLKNELLIMVLCAIRVGFNGMYVNEKNVIKHINDNFKNTLFGPWPDHHHHLHCSYIRQNGYMRSLV